MNRLPTGLRRPHLTLRRLKTAAALLATLSLGVYAAHAQNAKWSSNPSAGDDFNNPNNWVPTQVPTGTAFFGATSPNGRSPLTTSSATLNLIRFTALAPSYSIGILAGTTLTLDGGGVSNGSTNDQVIVVLSGGTLIFGNGATPGNDTVGYRNQGGTIDFNKSGAGSANFENESGGNITFSNGRADRAIISNNVGAATITFAGASNADSATLNNTTVAGDGRIIFTDISTAGKATITNFTANDFITFEGLSNAGIATITTDARSTINFLGASSGAVARFIVNSGGVFDISALTTRGM